MCELGRFIDLTGRKFGRLLVISPTDERGSDGSVVWKCKCDCGNIAYITSTNLKSNNSRSCGCYAKELVSVRTKKNDYEFSENGYCIGKTSNTGNSFYFDSEDLSLITQYTWREDKHGYIVTDIKGARSVRLHRLLYDYPDELIDHKNGNTKDNRRSNLRLATARQNSMNRKHGINSLTGIKGVTYMEDRNNYFGRIKINGKQIYLGTFDNIEDAIKPETMLKIKYLESFLWKIVEGVVSCDREKIRSISYAHRI